MTKEDKVAYHKEADHGDDVQGRVFGYSQLNIRTGELPRISRTAFHVLVAIGPEERHGYGIMQEVARITDGATRLGPGGVYTTIRRLLDMKQKGEKIVALTAYDFLFARLIDDIGVDVVLVGDSLGQVVLGHDSTLAVTVDDMIHHARAVRRGVGQALLVVDMPFLSFQVSPEETLRNAGRILAETGAEAVKVEGGWSITSV